MPLKRFVKAFREILDGDLSRFGGPQVGASIAGRFRAAQIGTIARFTPAMMAANVFNACILVLAFWGRPKIEIVYLWTFCLVTMALYIYLRHRARGPSQKGRTASVHAIHMAVRNGSIMGAFWSIPPLLLFPGASPGSQIIIISISIGQICGGAFTLASVPAAGLAFTVPIIFASAIALVSVNEPVYWLVMGLLIAYSTVLMRAMFVYASQLATRFIAELENEAAAKTDALTQLPNRVSFAEKLDHITDRTRRFGETHAVLFLDLDHFKDINDTFGHAAGDEFLVEVSRRLRMSVQEQDLIARISGDEFAIIAIGISTPEQAAVLAQRVIRSFEHSFSIHDNTIAASATIGIALLPADGCSALEIMQKADEALYAGKRRQRGTFQFVNAINSEHIRQRQEMIGELREAITREQFELEFQPFRNLQTSEITGYEALLRWRHPVRGLVRPSDFIALAEEANLIQEIGEWVLRNAIREAATWPQHLRVSINVSAAQFRSLEIASIIESAIRAARIAPHRVEVEITESIILSDIERTRAALARLRTLGVSVSLDDFGTGYSSLVHLVRLPVNRIKIDRYFVGLCASSEEGAKIVRAIIRLAREFNLAIIAEGVESADQFAFLKNAGCQEAQGYLLGLPARTIVSGEVREFKIRATQAA